MRKLAFSTLWLYVFTLSWEHSIDFAGGIGSVTRVVGILAMLAGVTAVAMRGSMRRITVFHATVIAFYLLVLASFFWGVDSDATAKAIRTFAQTIWVVWLIWEFASGMAQRRWLMLAYVMGSYVSIVATISNFAAMRVIAKGARISADGWNPNELAVMLAIGIPFAALLTCKPHRFFVRVVGIGYLLMAPATIILTASRGGAIAMGIAIIPIPRIFSKHSISRQIIALVLLGTVLAVAATVAPESSWNRLSTIGAEIATGNLNDRLPIWQHGLQIFEANLQNAIIGVGADGFLQAVGLGYVAHNTYLSILVNNGLVGFAVFLAILAQAALGGLRSEEPERWVIMASLLCWAVAVGSGSWEQNRATWFVLGLVYTSSFNVEMLPPSLQPRSTELGSSAVEVLHYS
jgi:O-antigen ligase